MFLVMIFYAWLLGIKVLQYVSVGWTLLLWAFLLSTPAMHTAEPMIRSMVAFPVWVLVCVAEMALFADQDKVIGNVSCMCVIAMGFMDYHWTRDFVRSTPGIFTAIMQSAFSAVMDMDKPPGRAVFLAHVCSLYGILCGVTVVILIVYAYYCRKILQEQADEDFELAQITAARSLEVMQFRMQYLEHLNLGDTLCAEAGAAPPFDGAAVAPEEAGAGAASEEAGAAAAKDVTATV